MKIQKLLLTIDGPLQCELDESHYEKGRKIRDEQIRSINLHPMPFTENGTTR